MTGSVRPPLGPGGVSPASGCACVPSSLTGRFLPDSVIDSILRLQHLGICAGLNEVWLPTTAREFKHTWDAGKGDKGEAEQGARVGGLGCLRWWGNTPK